MQSAFWSHWGAQLVLTVGAAGGPGTVTVLDLGSSTSRAPQFWVSSIYLCYQWVFSLSCQKQQVQLLSQPTTDTRQHTCTSHKTELRFIVAPILKIDYPNNALYYSTNWHQCPSFQLSKTADFGTGETAVTWENPWKKTICYSNSDHIYQRGWTLTLWLCPKTAAGCRMTPAERLYIVDSSYLWSVLHISVLTHKQVLWARGSVAHM